MPCKAAVLNSRQSLRPTGTDRWVTNTGKAVIDAASKDCTVLTSCDLNTWSLVLYFCSRNNIPARIYFNHAPNTDVDEHISFIKEQYHLDNNTAGYHFIPVQAKDKKHFQAIRDKTIINDSDIIYPVSVRPEGNLDKLIADANSEIIVNYRTKYSERKKSLIFSIEKKLVNTDINNLINNHLIHWTRTSNIKWPDETHFDFYNSITQSKDIYPRNAFNTLHHILASKTIIASSRHFRKDHPAVSFSSLPPSRAAGLMRYRARYREMTFEPYGIAVPKEIARKMMIKKVIYGNPEMFQYLDDPDKPYFQSIGKIGSWPPEKEWRHIGNLDLSRINIHDLTAIVWKPSEIYGLKEIFKGKIISYYKD